MVVLKKVLTKRDKYDIIVKMNNYKRNQLTVENVGSFMLLEKNLMVGKKKFTLSTTLLRQPPSPA